MKYNILSIFVEAVGFFEHEHNDPLEENIVEGLLNYLDEFDYKDNFTEYEKNTISTIIEIFFLYKEQSKLKKYKSTFINNSIECQKNYFS